MTSYLITNSEVVRGQLRAHAIVRVAEAVTRHPRFDRLFTSLDSLYSWLERAQARYLSEIERIGPTKARRQLARIVNEVALVGAR